ncbi:hypothetical protein ACR30L_15210 [Psychromonas sp. PT13]|uniref:hypothetical protein n=1 Tax=Psychromonas sp. PT13 TaxID=3439547 RepID=UPI003EBF74C8
MLRIENFNSLWEVAFAVNAIFVFFDLVPRLNKFFHGSNELGDYTIKTMLNEEDYRYVSTYGWKSILFGYVKFVFTLKLLSLFNSFFALVLIIIAGFNSSFQIGVLPFCFIVAILLIPVVIIPLVILYFLPRYKLLCLIEAIENIINRDNLDSEDILVRNKKYKIAVEYMKRFEFPYILGIKRNPDISNKEILSSLDNG